MKTLFDVSPEEPARKRPARGKKPAEGAIGPISIKQAPPTSVLLAVGRLDDVVDCIDPKCASACADILIADGREWLIQCCFCAKMQWIPALLGYLQPPKSDDEFVFRDGRFAGMTISQAALEPRGLQYVEWAAKQHKRDAVRAACKSWLDQRSAPA